MRVAAVIPAKGHSNGVPGKNKRLMHGKPLFMWSVEQALAANRIQTTYVSSDDEEILRLAQLHGAVPVFREAALCQDATPLEPVVEHALGKPPPDVVVILQPTSPCRTSQEIDLAVPYVTRAGYDSLLSVVPNYYFQWTKDGTHHHSLDYDWRKRPNRQDISPKLVENGSIYVTRYIKGFTSRLYGNIRVYPMDYWSAFEIDTQEDWDLVEFAMIKKGLVNGH